MRIVRLVHRPKAGTMHTLLRTTLGAVAVAVGAVTLAGTAGVTVATVLDAGSAAAQVDPTPNPLPDPTPCTSPDCDPQPGAPVGQRNALWSEAYFTCHGGPNRDQRGAVITVGVGAEMSGIPDGVVFYIFAPDLTTRPISEPITGAVQRGRSVSVFVPAPDATGTIIAQLWGIPAKGGANLPWKNGTRRAEQKIDCTCGTTTTTTATTVPDETTTTAVTTTTVPGTPTTGPTPSTTPGTLPQTGSSSAVTFAWWAFVLAAGGGFLLYVGRKFLDHPATPAD